jgi:hypothetical protein
MPLERIVMVKTPQKILPFPPKPTDMSEAGLALACIVVAIVPKCDNFADDEYNAALDALEEYDARERVDRVMWDVMKDPRMRNFACRVGYSDD